MHLPSLCNVRRLITGAPKPAEMPLARRRCDMVFFFAVSDGEWLGVDDLLSSIETFIDCDYQLVAIDDATGDGSYEKLLDLGVWTARNPVKMGLWGLDVTIRRALHNAFRIFEAPVFIKIDPDALLIGPGFQRAVAEAFDSAPKAGIAGTYKIDWDGTERDLSFWRDRMQRVGREFGAPLRMALRNGYRLGDGVQGGCYAIRGECVARMAELGFLDKWTHPNSVRGRQVAEDSVMTMLTYAAGFEGIDIGGPGQAFGLWDKGLPMEPDQLVKQKRVVTHAIKYQDEASLAARRYFRALRSAYQRGIELEHHQTPISRTIIGRNSSREDDQA